MFTVETDANSAQLLRGAEEVLGQQVEYRRSGRLGLEVALPQAEAERLADWLRQAGHQVVCADREDPGAWHAQSSEQ